MHSVYKFDRVSRKYVKNVIAALEREAEALDAKLQYLADLDEGSAHIMMEAGYEFELNEITNAIQSLREYEKSRID